MEILIVGILVTAFGLAVLHSPRKEPYWPKVTESYIKAIFAESEQDKKAALDEFNKLMGIK